MKLTLKNSSNSSQKISRIVCQRLCVYLNEQKAVTSDQAAIHAVEFVLTHKISFTVGQHPDNRGRGLLSEMLPFKSTSPVSACFQKDLCGLFIRETVFLLQETRTCCC